MTETAQKTIVLCPGQGAQVVGMGKAWADVSAAAAQTFTEADDILGYKLSDLCFNGPEERLNRTDEAQAALYTTGVACYRALQERGEAGELTATAGLSLGEFTALHLAGAFSFATGLRLVRLRGQAMQQAAENVAGGSGMVALIGAEDEQVQTLCEQARGNDVLVAANYNCPGQIVISGSASACERALVEAEKMGLRATALKVAGAFHSPLVQPAADQLAAAFNEAQWKVPGVPVVSNVTAQPHESDIESIKRRLVEQLTSPVKWTQSMQWMVSNYPADNHRYIEIAPNKVLFGLMRRIDRNTRVANFDKPE